MHQESFYLSYPISIQSMQKIPIYQVDAFTNKLFGGNPAAICPLQEWLPDAFMHQIAMENNLAETAFTVPYEDGFHIRWFTPETEVALCGHATLATAFVYFNELGYGAEVIRFFSLSGWLSVKKESNGQYTLDFPADLPTVVDQFPHTIFEGLGIAPTTVYKGKFDYLVVLETEEQVAQLQPNFQKMFPLHARGLLVTAKGNTVDFVSRCFFPDCGIPEDPVTGSAHCTLVSYWNQKTGKEHFNAAQLSARKGFIQCTLVGDRVLLSGEAILFMKGEIFI